MHSSRNFFCQVFVLHWAFSLSGKNISGLAWALEAMGFPTATLPPAVGNKTGAVSKKIRCEVLEAFRFPATVKGNGFFLQGITPAVLNKGSQRRGQGQAEERTHRKYFGVEQESTLRTRESQPRDLLCQEKLNRGDPLSENHEKWESGEPHLCVRPRWPRPGYLRKCFCIEKPLPQAPSQLRTSELCLTATGG